MSGIYIPRTRDSDMLNPTERARCLIRVYTVCMKVRNVFIKQNNKSKINPTPQKLEMDSSNTLYEPRHEKICLCHMRTTNPRNLISAFVVCCLGSIISLVSTFAI